MISHTKHPTISSNTNASLLIRHDTQPAAVLKKSDRHRANKKLVKVFTAAGQRQRFFKEVTKFLFETTTDISKA